MSINNQKAPLFQPDYLISWDFSDHDHPCVSVVCVERDKDKPKVVARFLGRSFEQSGIISLRQLLEYRDAEDRWEEKKRADIERLRQTFTKEDGGPVLDQEGEA